MSVVISQLVNISKVSTFSMSPKSFLFRLVREDCEKNYQKIGFYIKIYLKTFISFSLFNLKFLHLHL